MSFICMRMKKHFQIKGWALNLVLIQRPGVSRKWRDPFHFHDTHAQKCRLLVLSVTPFKIDQNQNENRSIDKVQNLGNERRYIYKDPRQDSGKRNISYTRYPKKCFTQTCRDLYGDAMPVLTWMSSNMVDGNQVLLQKCEFILRVTHKH